MTRHDQIEVGAFSTPPSRRRCANPNPMHESDPTISDHARSHPSDLTLFQVMRRPRWIGVLLIALIVAAGFAFLGRWQLDRALQAREVGPQITETTHPLEDVLTPGKAIAN